MKHYIGLLLLLLCGSCGYHYRGYEGIKDPLSVSVPYIQGDSDSLFNSELIYQLSCSQEFSYVQSGGDLILKVRFLSDVHDRIGFRYDRDNPKGTLEKNLLGVEDRRTIIAEVSLLDAVSGRVLLEPTKIMAFTDYDYTDPGSPRDLLFSNRKPIIKFSLGQLDSEEGAHDDSARPLFRKLSQKIIMGLLNKLPEIREES